MIYGDVETIGFHGIAVLIQWAKDDGEIHLHEVWNRPIQDTLDLIEMFVTDPDGVVFFNAVFDWFHIQKLYTIFRLYPDKTQIPKFAIHEIAALEMEARDGPCVKPVSACDLYLHACKGPYQSTMERKDIKIKRVPTVLAYQLAAELESRVKIKDIYFARRKNKGLEKWSVEEIEDNPDFKNVVLRFAASGSLKTIAADVFNIKEDEVLRFTDIEVPRKFLPKEVGYAPYAKALKGTDTWPYLIKYHIDHWAHHQLARKYAKLDVDYVRRLYQHFGSPEPGDDDSVLACAVASMRWRGFAIDLEKLKALREKALLKSESAPKYANYVRRWLYPHLSEVDKAVLKGSTSKVVLHSIAQYRDTCEQCEGEGHDANGDECNFCTDGETIPECAKRAQMILDARSATKEREVYDKIILAGRVHAAFKVIGARSGRMSGKGGQLNFQATKKLDEVRECYTLAWPGLVLCGGDFDSFEVGIAVAVYKDPQLEADLKKLGPCAECGARGKKKGKICGECKGTGKDVPQKIHGLFAMSLFPGTTYEEIARSSGTANDYYKRGKTGVFTKMFGGNFKTLMEKVMIEEEEARAADEDWERRYPEIKKSQIRMNDKFASMRQPNGIGSKVVWHDPDDYVESLLGHRRYYTLENMITKALFDLGEKPPPSWLKIKEKVVRRDRVQFAGGAVRSSLFGAAFAVQSANVRSATNHEIQATGGEITKRVQRNIWDYQPSGIHEFVVMPLNMHDEVLAPVTPELVEPVKETVNKTVASFVPLIPMIKMGWKTHLTSWAKS